MKRSLYIIIGVLALVYGKSVATPLKGVAYTKEDSLTITRLLSEMSLVGDTCLSLHFARQFLERPYVAHTLELFPVQERLIVNTIVPRLLRLLSLLCSVCDSSARRLPTIARS